jgi:hypothetical protein
MNKIVFPLQKNKAPALPKGTDWRTYKGEANTPMVGVMIPQGVVVLDLDLYKGVSTEQVESELGCSLDWDSAQLQETLKGGMHYAFRIGEGVEIANGVNVAGVEGLDIRSPGKGYIATGEGYNDLTLFGVIESLHEPETFPELPVEVVKRLNAPSSAAEDDDLLSAIAAQPLDISIDEVEAYMNKLTPSHAEESDTWLKVGFALSHQTGGSDEGWLMFDKFSRLSPEKYDKRRNKTRWESFKKETRANPITFASVIKLVGGNQVIVADKFEALRERVVQADNKEQLESLIRETAELPLDEINTTLMVKALQKSFNNLIGEKLSEQQIRKILRKSRPKKHGDYHEDYVFLTSTGEYMCRITKTCMGPRAFDVKHGRDTPTDQEGNPQSATSYADSQIECVHSGMYAPMFGEVFMYDGVDYFNTYKPNPIKRKPIGDTVEKVKSHIAHLLPDEYEQSLVVDYLANNVQNPGKKIHWAMILQGVQGDGKSFLAEMMRHVLGQTNCKTISVESLDEKFTSWAEGSCMVFIEELKLDNYKKYETLNKLKPYISNPTVPVRRMRMDTYEAINTTNYFALTNFKDALPIDDNDRRYCVLFSQWQSKERLVAWMEDNPDYYPDLYESMRNNIGEIIEWLATHKISDKFKSTTRAPETRAKLMMADMAKSDDWLAIEDAIAHFECEDINDNVVNITKLYAKATDVFEAETFKDFPKTKRIRNIMLEMGYHAIGRYKDEDRKNQTIYCKDDTAKPIDFKPVPF